MPNRIMIMPAGTFQVPAIGVAQEMGLEVVAIDRNPGAPGLALADFAEAVDPSDVPAAISVAQRYEIGAVVSLASDPSVIPSAMITDALGLPGLAPDAARVARNKLLVRRRVADRLPAYSPRFLPVTSAADLSRVGEKVGLPAVLKPTDSNGSKGVTLVESADMLEQAYRYALKYSTEGVVIAEEKLAGREVSVEGITCNGKSHLLAITDKLTTAPPYCVETGHTIPSGLARSEQAAVLRATEEIIDALAIDWGATHTELFITPDGPKLVELGARLGGGCIATHLVPLATGVDMVRAAIDLALGRTPDLQPGARYAAAIRFITPAPGRVRAVEGLEDARRMAGIVEAEFALGPGEQVQRLENSDHRVGYVIAKGKDRAQAVQRVERAVARVRIRYQEEPTRA